MTFEQHCRESHSLPDICCPNIGFEITLEEGQALNYLLRLHEGLLRQSPEHHIHILRLINGLGDWINRNDAR